MSGDMSILESAGIGSGPGLSGLQRSRDDLLLRRPPESELRELRNGLWLAVDPGQTETRQEFQRWGEMQLAGDGRVRGPSYWDPEALQGSLDHHEGANRATTFCTCMQGYEQVAERRFLESVGLTSSHHPLTLRVKEPDPDVSGFVYVFDHAQEVVAGVHREALLSWLRWEDKFDRWAGFVACDPADPEAMGLAWTCAPYEEARMNPQRSMLDLSGAEMADIIQHTCARIDRYVSSGGCSAPDMRRELDTRYEKIGGGPRWWQVKELGFYARVGLANDTLGLGNGGAVEGLILSRQVAESAWMHTVMKTSGFSRFAVGPLCHIYNAAENIAPNAPFRWGGGDFIIGSPYTVGSTLDREKIETITNDLIAFAKGGPITLQTAWAFIADRFPEYARRVAEGDGALDYFL
jgi:hypothetical protein